MKRTKEEILRDAGLYQADSFDRYFADRVLGAMEEYAKECMPKWISVKDTLPEESSYVLAHNGNYSQIAYYAKQFELVNSDWILKPRIWVSSNNDRPCIFTITHWMEIPKGPTE